MSEGEGIKNFRKTDPYVNGRSPVEEMTGGAAPPRVPVKVWTLSIYRS